ncbi:MAG: DNA polymerase III subunit delta [Gammaproteobacteria bacterium]|nr:DNA polymerase III subunit delta [Gammaproteobacteria bacterium]MBM4209403.1 DNA polymerase III subunit delta [Gammaproteobacteria bacterium]MBM4231384.1 DNA polymerase III subunit delta [Gammaproteobacteria bacterium]
MKLALDNLGAHLKQAAHRGQLAATYLVSGDEDLLVAEACDAIRAAARQAGYSEREVHFPERNADWADIVAAAGSMSLFGDRRLIELRFSGKAGKEGGAALQSLIAREGDDTLLLLITPRLDFAAQSTAWVKAVEAKGAWLPIWEVGPRQLEGWLSQRLRAAGLDPSADAVTLLAARVEGNLLAAQQEIEKLKLLVPAGRLDAAAVLNAVASSARYDVFALSEAVVTGDAARALRILSGLRGEGTEPTLVLWAITRELRNLWSLKQGDDPSRRPGPRLTSAQLAALERARPRASRLPFARLSSRALRADRMIKGRLAGDPWDELTLLCAEFCGLRPVR